MPQGPLGGEGLDSCKDGESSCSYGAGSGKGGRFVKGAGGAIIGVLREHRPGGRIRRDRAVVARFFFISSINTTENKQKQHNRFLDQVEDKQWT